MTKLSLVDGMSRPACARAGSAYGWMALTAFIVIVAGKLLLPFPGQQRAQNVSLVIEAIVGAALGLGAFRLFDSRGRAK